MDMGVDHRGLETAMTKQGLDRPDVRSVGEQVHCKRVAQCMHAGVFDIASAVRELRVMRA